MNETVVPQPAKDPFQPTDKLERHLRDWSNDDYFLSMQVSRSWLASRRENWALAIDRLIEACGKSRTQIEGIGRALIAVAETLPLQDWEIRAGRNLEEYPEDHPRE